MFQPVRQVSVNFADNEKQSNKTFNILYFMKTNLVNLALGLAFTGGAVSCQSQKNDLVFEHQGDTVTIVHIARPANYLLLPIQESSKEGLVRLDTGSPADTDMDVRLATDSVEYYVPFALPQGSEEATVIIKKVAADALCWDSIRVSDTFDTANRDKFRPVYHHTPLYGWMNDANGLVYKDGEYHLYFQYNPYGSVWGNMHWGHSVSKDLVHWEHLDPAIARDTLGHIFSGSAIVDKHNSAGYGENTIVAFYTSHRNIPGGQSQVQSMAYSTDNGRTYTKYEQNPVLTPFDGLQNFRDPKVFWYEPEQKWIMIVSADKNMRFYSSANLKQWEYMSEFGEGFGPQPNQFECPDFIQLPVDGDRTRMKWVMIVNINPGFVYGGSGTMYFTGDFDGHQFVCDTKPEVVKWLDWGKDHYATVCFSNTGDRVIAVPWMSNWQYANYTPIQQFRSANALPRELSLYTGEDKQLYLSAAPVKETEHLRKDSKKLDDFTVNGEKRLETLFENNDGAFELELQLVSAGKEAGFELLNSLGEKVKIYLDASEGRVVMDRAESGIVDFGKKVKPHDLDTEESYARYKEVTVNYKNMNSNKNLYAKLIPVMLCFFAMGFVDLVGIASNYVKADLDLTDSQANIFPSLVFFWFLIFSVPTGILMNKIGRKKTVLLSLIVTFASLLLPIFGDGYTLMLISFSLLGIGNALMQTSLNPLLSNIIAGEKLASTLTFGQFVKAIASFLAPYIAMWGAMQAIPTFGLGWRVLFPVYMVIAVFAIVLLGLTPIEEEKPDKASGFKACFSLLGKPFILLSFIGIMCHVGIDVGTNTTAPKILMERLDMTLAEAGFATSLYFIFRTVGCFLGAFILQKASAKSFFALSVVFMLLAMVGLFIFHSETIIYICIAMIGFGNSNVFSIIFSQALFAMPEKKNEVSGLMIMGLFGGTVFPLAMGVAGDAMGQSGAVAVMTVGVIYLLMYTLKIKK